MNTAFIDFSDIPDSISDHRALAAELQNLTSAKKALREAEGNDFTQAQYDARSLAAKLALWKAVAAYSSAMIDSCTADIDAAISA